MPDRWRVFQTILGARLTLLRLLEEENNGWSTWLAEDSHQQQVVATVWPEWRPLEPEARTRLLREAALYSRLQHPGIVPLLSYAEQGEWFWYVRPGDLGQPLRDLMGPALEPERVLPWLRQITAALAYAHQSGVVHQQLGPDCIWVQEDRVRLSDFAFAKLQAQVVHVGSYDLPSPRFMAPEQILGGPLSPATNYFTLGSLAFELLSGRPLFEADNSIQVIFKIIQEELPSLEHLSPPFEELLLRLLERDPQKRLSQAAEVLGYLEGGVVSASGPEIQEVLAELRAEGQTVTENEVFTLDPAQALEKLSHFRFPEPWEWLVSLCAAGAALGAEKLSLEWQKRRLTLNYQGVRLNQEQLRNFWLSAYGSHQGGSGYLARGLASALTQHGGWVEVASAGWKLRTDQVQKERLGRALVTQLQVRLEDCPEPAWDQVRRRFLFTPLPICWQGRWQSTVVANRPFPTEGFSLRVDLLEAPLWLAVVDGMSFPLEHLVLESGRVVVWGPLRLDADRRALLEDEQLAELRLQLKAAIEAAIEDFALAPESLDSQPTRLYRRALVCWKEGGQDDKLDRFTSAFLNLQDGGLDPSKTAEECFRRAAGWATPPAKFWELACRSRWFPLLSADWEKALEISQRAFAQEHARLHWLLQCWLEWGLVKPDLEQLGSLLSRFPDQRLDARFDPLLHARLPVDELSISQRQGWLLLLPKHWTQSRLRLRRTGANPSRE
ncbi:MAG: protein kinase [Candidatus Eremiobacteraeota bacterium]|nr:protein kinase [Candidatus Eremiobacteraeota bacterium]